MQVPSGVALGSVAGPQAHARELLTDVVRVHEMLAGDGVAVRSCDCTEYTHTFETSTRSVFLFTSFAAEANRQS